MYAAQPTDPIQMTEADYLAFADDAPEKYEYRQGCVYAMTGGSIRHSVITANTSTHLSNLLDDKDCSVTSPDARLHIASKAAYRYPDVAVFCGAPAYVQERTDTFSNPILLVEILSPSTASIDHIEKLEEYTQIESLAAYLLVAQDEVRVKSYIRQETGQWFYQSVTGLDDTITIPALSITLELARLYRRVDWTDESA